jgi:hypothetical protein
MKNALWGLLVASLMVVGLPAAKAKDGVGPQYVSDSGAAARAEFEKDVTFYLRQVEDLRSLSVNNHAQRAPVSRLRDQNLDGTPKEHGLPEWFVRWHAASDGGKNPEAKGAVAARDGYMLGRLAATAGRKEELDRQGLNELLGRINSLNEMSRGVSMSCSKITGCVAVGSAAVLSSPSRSNVKRPVYNSGEGEAEGAGTGMSLSQDGR